VHHRRGEDRRHARSGGDAAFGAFHRRQAILKHGHRGIGVARIHHSFFVVGEARRGLRRVVEQEARSQEQRFGVLVELGAHLPGAHALGRQLMLICHKKTRPLFS
jgi:hypothetical protein